MVGFERVRRPGRRGRERVESHPRFHDGSQNNPAYKLDCSWDMETERGEQREARRREGLHVAIAKRETRINARIPAHVPARTCTTNTRRAYTYPCARINTRTRTTRSNTP